MIIKEIKSKSVLIKSNLPESDYCINPYVGCLHGCKYCYARFMKRFTGHREPWGEFLDIKINALEVLRKQLNSKKNISGRVLLGSVSDAYQPAEKKYGITRGILKELKKANCSVSILTKSDLVVRDIDILKELNNCSVGLTITTTNDWIRSKLEPRAASIERRIEALRKLHENGISTYCFIGPIIPFLTDIRAIFQNVHNLIDYMWGEALNVRAGNWDCLEEELELSFPEILPKIKSHVKSPDYWNDIESEFKALCQEYKIPMVGFFRH